MTRDALRVEHVRERSMVPSAKPQSYYGQPVLKHPVTRRDGFAIPFDTPGHGIEFDPDALEAFTVCRSKSSSSPAHQPA